MTTAALSPSATYIEDGVTLNFAAPFRYLAASSLAIDRIVGTTVTRLQLGVHYSATAGTTDAGGTVTLTSSVAGARLRIRRATARAQATDYATNDRFPAESHEAALDRAMLIDQEQDVVIADTVARALTVPDGEIIGNLPAKSVRAGNYLAFGPDGEALPASGTGADAALRADLARTIAGFGASIIGRAGGGSVEKALLPDSYTAQVPTDASTTAGTGTGGATALQTLASGGAPEVRLNAFYDFANPATGSTLLDNAVTIPTGQRWGGAGIRAKFVVAVTDPKPGGYFMLGADASAQSAQNYDLYPNKSFGGIYLDGRAAAGAGKSPIGIVVGGPSWRVHDVYAFSMQTVVRTAETTGAYGQLNAHADHLRISNVHLNAQPNPVDFDPANPGNARYGIDFLRAVAGADGAEIERCQSNVTGVLDSGTAKRCRFIGLRAFTSAKVRGIINGDVYFYQSTGVVEDSYFESGVISNLQSEMVLRSCQFFMRNEVTVGTDIGAVPVQLLATPAGVASASAVPSSLSLRDCSFNYDAVGSGSTPGNLNGSLGGYTLTNPNFSIGAGVYGTMTVENCWRAAPYSNGRGWYMRLGITCGMAEFDNYSHFASVLSRYTGSGTGGDRWTIEAKRGAISATSATALNGLESASFDTAFKGPFRAASATYYYRVAILHDKIRGIGILGGLEVSQAAVSGATGAVNLRLGFDLPGGGFIARIYRGTAAGSYDKYVDVPVIEAGRLYDSGVDIGGFPWINRAAGAADTVNAGLSGGIEIGPGERTAASDAYGRCVAWSLTGAMPTVGGWRRGDEVRYATGKWQRLTNCTAAAPAHVVNVDWKQITY